MPKRKKKTDPESEVYSLPDSFQINQAETPRPALLKAEASPELRPVRPLLAPVTGETAQDLAASKAWRFNSSQEELLAILNRGKFENLKLIPWGSNYTFIAPLCDPSSGHDYAIIYKPMRGEAPLWDFPNGTLYKREYCAYLVSHALNWHFIPPVVVREGPHGIGTVQLFVDVDENQQYYDFRDEHLHELKRIAIFDYITNNADRKAGHCLKGLNNYIWAIDHGICFNHVPKLRTVIWDFAEQPIPADIYQDLADLVNDKMRLGQLHAQLEQWLEQREIELFLERIEHFLQNPYFPSLNSRRQIPWGFY
jgi:uncharacterized repeat protein (TIGR03843 family)